ncbi:MAG: sulfite exporter TauE/SafE family protein [Gammaproteobacteria bacterium]|nr:MAG: sulfite exporter TauE/SafE family protein [Gammaproteobacteria bacterium]
MQPLEQLILFIISLIANIFSAFAGGGAGLLQLPALIFLGLGFSVALATHKVASVALGVGATIRHLREKSLERWFALFILATGMPGVILGAHIILKVPDRHARTALGILTLMLGVYSWSKHDLGLEHKPVHRDSTGYLYGGVALFMIGALNGSLTSGTGLFVTMWLVRWFGLDYKRAVAYTLILVGMFWNGTGAITLGLLADIKWSWLPVLLLGSLLGGYTGAHLAISKGNKWIKHVFEVLTVFVGIALITT